MRSKIELVDSIDSKATHISVVLVDNNLFSDDGDIICVGTNDHGSNERLRKLVDQSNKYLDMRDRYLMVKSIQSKPSRMFVAEDFDLPLSDSPGYAKRSADEADQDQSDHRRGSETYYADPDQDQEDDDEDKDHVETENASCDQHHNRHM